MGSLKINIKPLSLTFGTQFVDSAGVARAFERHTWSGVSMNQFSFPSCEYVIQTLLEDLFGGISYGNWDCRAGTAENTYY